MSRLPDTPPTFEPGPGERLLHLDRGFTALINDVDWDLVSGYTWHAFTNHGTNVYAKAWRTVARKRSIFYLHRVITSCPKGLIVDHANGIGLDNRRRNLRITTGTFNAHNAPYEGVLGVRGVVRDKNKFRARIKFKGERLHLGMFETLEEATKAYDDAALELFGPFAWTNEGRAVDRAAEVVEKIPF